MQKFKTETEQDEYIIGCILASAATLRSKGIPVRRGQFGVFAVECAINAETDKPRIVGPCCAVGAGILYREVKPLSGRQAAGFAFAKMYNVTPSYAYGVSDAFEGSGEPSNIWKFDVSYMRGFQVGLVLAEALRE